MNRPQDTVDRFSRVVCLLALAGLMLTGCGAPIASAIEPDPAALLGSSAGSLYEGDTAALSLTATVRIAQGEESQDNAATYRFAREGGGGFFLEPVLDGESAQDDGVFVRGDGELILTYIPQLGRFTLQESGAGIAEFIRSPLSQGVGSPLGGVGLSLLHPETTDEMVGRLTASEYVGEAKLGETTTHRCRYTVDDQVTFDVWFTTGEKPRALRLESDLSELMRSGDPIATDVAYVVVFEYVAEEAPAEAEFVLTAPEGATHVESFFRQPASEAPHRLLGEAAPAFELASLAGESVNLADHLGKDVVVLDFWATWCPPCVAALPAVDRITRSYAEQGVVFFAVDQGETAETVNSFLESKELSPPVLMDAEGAAASAYDVEGLPTSVIIGRDGTVQVVHVGFGPNLESQLTRELDALVAGQDLAGEKVREHHEQQVQRRQNLERLRAKLADPS